MTEMNGRGSIEVTPKDQADKKDAEKTVYLLHTVTTFNQTLFQQKLFHDLDGAYSPTDLEILHAVESSVGTAVPAKRRKSVKALLARRREALEQMQAPTAQDDAAFVDVLNDVYDTAPAVRYLLEVRQAIRVTTDTVACAVFLKDWRNVPDAENPVELQKVHGSVPKHLMQNVPLDHRSEIYGTLLKHAGVDEQDAKN